MDYEITWTEPAVADLEAIVRYLTRRSQNAAESVRSSILSHVETLARFPFIGPVEFTKSSANLTGYLSSP